MGALPPFGDVAPALEVCRAAARGAPPEAVRGLALDALLRLVPAEAALWVGVHAAGERPEEVVARPGPAEGKLLAGYADHVAGHAAAGIEEAEPMVHHLAGVGDGHQLCLVLPATSGSRSGMALHRAVPFTAAERDRLEAFAPLVTCAVLAAGRAPMPALLTTREAAVLRSVATGMSDKQAARALGVSPRTVGKHLEHIYAKLGVAGRTEAAAHLWIQG